MKKTDRHSAMWPKRPRIYEINTSVWLHDLTVRYGTPLTLATIPGHEWDRISGLHIDAVWFMGLWARSAMGRAIAGRDGSLSDEFRRVLPDFQEGDNVGSPYCVRSYEVDNCFGGPEGLAVARERLAERGVRLVADFVPNHVAPDHRWVADHPEYFIRGDEDDLAADPRSFLAAGSQVFACGKDPYFPSWPDVLQLNAFHPGLREAAIATVVDLAARCDGVRCDMAMLFITDIFARTWGDRAGPAPEEEYWRAVIKAVKEVNPSFLFIAEAYWDREWELQTQGFDYCYDKKLYDRLVHGSAEDVRLHLCAQREYQDRLLRFIENHDEPRAAAVFSPMKGRSAALIVATVPGAVLYHEGQLEGRTERVPVFLGRRPREDEDEELSRFYRRLCVLADQPAFREGDWHLCDRSGWHDNDRYRDLLAWSWSRGEDRYLIVINFSGLDVQGRVHLPWGDLAENSWVFDDRMNDHCYERDGSELALSGLYVALTPWGAHLFQVSSSDERPPIGNGDCRRGGGEG